MKVKLVPNATFDWDTAERTARAEFENEVGSGIQDSACDVLHALRGWDAAMVWVRKTALLQMVGGRVVRRAVVDKMALGAETTAMSKPSHTLRPPTDREKAALRATLGCRVSLARGHLKLSQRGLGRVMSMSGSWVREIESGFQFAPAWLLAMLVEATGWNIAWFYGFGPQKWEYRQPMDPPQYLGEGKSSRGVGSVGPVEVHE